jgi:hypothetical protein
MTNKFKKYGEAGKYMQLLLKVGSIMILSILIFFGVGFFIIKKFNLNGSIIIFFVFTGVACGFLNVYREIKRLE